MSKVPDNFYLEKGKEFPARMSDGRFMTDYSPNCQRNFFYQKDMTSWQYRMYLTNMADTILEKEHDMDEEEFGCNDCSKNVFIPKNEYEQKCDGVRCNVNFVNQNGHGIDTKYV